MQDGEGGSRGLCKMGREEVWEDARVAGRKYRTLQVGEGVSRGWRCKIGRAGAIFVLITIT